MPHPLLLRFRDAPPPPAALFLRCPTPPLVWDSEPEFLRHIINRNSCFSDINLEIQKIIMCNFFNFSRKVLHVEIEFL